MKSLETMDFGSLADAGEAMMKQMGMDDMSALIGWKTANNLMKIGMTVPRAFSVRTYSFSAKFDANQFFCDNGEVRRKCDDKCVELDRCPKLLADEAFDLQCKLDECNNCAHRFFFIEGGKEVEFDRCATCASEFKKNIDNLVLKRVYRNNVEAQYMCNNGFVSKDCNSIAVCDYKSGNNKITYPSCVDDKCDWPTFVENGFISSGWRDEDMSGDTCPFKQIRCYDGYSPEDGERIECDVRDDYKISKTPVCKMDEKDDDEGQDWIPYIFLA
jgi:hypothetical protein